MENLADLLRDRTQPLHTQAERTGIVRDILTGRVDRNGYALFLRNLLPAYEALEAGLSRNCDRRGIDVIAVPEIYRAGTLISDLNAIAGSSWLRSLPLLPAGERYARRVDRAADGDTARLIAHAYTRYLGDLNGGQALRRVLARSLDLEPRMLTFYDFPEIDDLKSFTADYRDAIDRAGTSAADASTVIEEAAAAFQYNIDVSIAVKAAAARQ